MADNGYIKATAGQTFRVTYAVRRTTAAATHIVVDNATTSTVRTFTDEKVGDAEDSFKLTAGKYAFVWTVLALAKTASVVVQIEVDGSVRYRKDIAYSSSGVTPWGTATFDVREA
ncbi:MAG: hypothetical protein ABIQ70_09300 [Dokdonella sp.]